MNILRALRRPRRSARRGFARARRRSSSRKSATSPKTRLLPEWMRVGYFLDYCKPFYPTWNDADLAALVRAYELPLDRPLKALSRGMKVKAALAASLAYRPRLIVLDEPFSGLDVLVREQLIESILDRTPEATVCVSSHDLARNRKLRQPRRRISTKAAWNSSRRWARSPGGSAKSRSPWRRPPNCRANCPRTWLNPEQSGVAVRFTDSHYDAARSREEIRRRFGAVREVEARQIPFRSFSWRWRSPQRGPHEPDAAHLPERRTPPVAGRPHRVALLALLARTDRWRADPMIGSDRGLAQSGAAAGVGLPGRPRRPRRAADRRPPLLADPPASLAALLAAKLLFALLFVHCAGAAGGRLCSRLRADFRRSNICGQLVGEAGDCWRRPSPSRRWRWPPWRADSRSS